MREYMDMSLFTQADAQSIDIVERGIDDLRKLGATIVDPGAGKALFQECVRKYAPATQSGLFTQQFPQLFPVDAPASPPPITCRCSSSMLIRPAQVSRRPDDSRPWRGARRSARADTCWTCICANAATRPSRALRI